MFFCLHLFGVFDSLLVEAERHGSDASGILTVGIGRCRTVRRKRHIGMMKDIILEIPDGALPAYKKKCVSNVGSGFGVGSGSLIAGTDGSSVGLSVFSGFSGSTGGCLASSDAGAFDSVGALTGSEEIAGPLSCLSSFGMESAGSTASVGAFGSVDTGSKEAGVLSCGVGAFGVFPAVCPCNGSAAHPESNTESRSAHNMRFFFMG